MSVSKSGTSRARRNEGRVLVAVIESADSNQLDALRDLSALTEAYVARLGLDPSRWPESVRDVLTGDAAARRWVREDDRHEEHVFALFDAGDFDIFFGVSSRRKLNDPGVRSENLATNVLLEVLATPGTEEPMLYGQLIAQHSSRVLRHAIAGSFVLNHCEEWDVLLSCSDLKYDPMIDPSPYGAAVTLTQNAQSATHFVNHSSKHRISAHERGINKWARTNTPQVLSLHPETGFMGWDEAVVEAVRDAVALLQAGTSWDDTAAVVGRRIPSYRLRAEPDRAPEDWTPGPKARTREDRNRQRATEGRPLVAYKYLPDGRPNPAYEPETLQDNARPAVSLRAMLLNGVAPRPADATVLEHPRLPDHRDADLLLLSEGLFLRLVKDQELSNRTVTCLRFVEYQLPPLSVDEDGTPRYVITHEQADFLRSLRSDRKTGSSTGFLPLSGVFTARLEDELYTRHGYLSPAGGPDATLTSHDLTVSNGRVVWSTAGPDIHGNLTYGIIFRRWTPDIKKTDIYLGRVDTDTMHQSVIDTVLSALEKGPAGATFTVTGSNNWVGADALLQAQRAEAAAQESFDGAVAALAAPALTPLVRASLQERAAAAETDLVRARDALDAARASAKSVHDAQVALDAVVDVLACLRQPVPLDPQFARLVQRRLASILLDAKIWVEPVSATLRWSATLELRTQHGLALRIPVECVLANAARDVWITGVAAEFWHRRSFIYDIASARGLRHDVATNRISIRPLEQRFLFEARRTGVTWRGENAIRTFARCPHSAILRAGFAILLGEDPRGLSSELLDGTRDVFFGDGDDLPADLSWGKRARLTPSMRRLVGLALDASDANVA